MSEFPTVSQRVTAAPTEQTIRNTAASGNERDITISSAERLKAVKVTNDRLTLEAAQLNSPLSEVEVFPCLSE